MESPFGFGRRVVVDRNKTTQYTEAWVVLALVLILIGLLTRRPALLTIAALLLVILPAAWAWNRLALQGVVYERMFGERRAFAGENIPLIIRITNRKLLPVPWLKIEDEIPTQLPVLDAQVQPSHKPQTGVLSAIYSLRWYEQAERIYTLHCAQRGYYAYGPVTLRAGDIFGLFEDRRRLAHTDWLIVYPRVVPLEELGLPAKDPLGELAVRRRLFEDPSRTMGVRDYQPHDDFRRIHWKATARRQSLQVRVYEPTTSFNLAVCLNVANFRRYWQGYDPVLLEKTIMVAASVAHYAAERRYAVGLVANGCLPESDQPIRVPPGRAPTQLVRVLEMLAAVTPIASVPFEDLLITAGAELPWGSTMVVVTGIVTEEIAESLQRLRAAGRHMVLISLEESPPPELDGVLTYHLPQLRDAADDAAAMAAGLRQPLSQAEPAQEAVP